MNEKVADLWRKFKAIFCRKYDNNKFWNIRHALETPEKLNPLVRAVYILYYEKENRRSNADIAIGFDEKNGKVRENFASPPNITNHGINGIVIAGGAQIGKNVTISHQVTIGRSRGKAPVIGDNVYIGPGAKIFGGIRIGNNVNIGANCVVFENVPDNATIVLNKPRIIFRDQPHKYFTFTENEYKSKTWEND